MSPACSTGWSCQPETRDPSEFAFILETSVSRAWREEGGHRGQLNKKWRGGASSPVLPGAREVAGGLGLPGRGTVAQKVLWAQGRPRQAAGPPSQPLANVSWELAPPHGPGRKVRGLCQQGTG